MRPPIYEPKGRVAKPSFLVRLAHWWPRNRIIRRLWFGLYHLWRNVYELATTRYRCRGRYVLLRDIGSWWDSEQCHILPEGVEPPDCSQSGGE